MDDGCTVAILLGQNDGTLIVGHVDGEHEGLSVAIDGQGDGLDEGEYVSVGHLVGVTD